LPGAHYADLLVGTDTSDDAAVYRLNDAQAIVATTDFFMPIVDDPFDFGRIAATNALSDIYAMGARPLLALAIVGMPINTLPTIPSATSCAAASRCARWPAFPSPADTASIRWNPSMDWPSPAWSIPQKIKRNSRAEPGDLLVLGKPLGVGIFSAAFKKDLLDEPAYRVMIETTTQLNLPGMELANLAGVHAMTDVTGFGLLGHLLEMCRGSGLGALIEADRVPLAARGTGARRIRNRDRCLGRNWLSYGKWVRAPNPMSASRQAILTDPQTSGGLLVACDPENCRACKRSSPVWICAGIGDRPHDGREAVGTRGVKHGSHAPLRQAADARRPRHDHPDRCGRGPPQGKCPSFRPCWLSASQRGRPPR
jgi:selenide,water dikinase